jgi:methylmalonyl-CoA mutase N-terminal domain/subunit
MTINAPAMILLAFYVLVGEQQGVPAERLGGTDPDRHPQGASPRSEWCFLIEPAMRLVTDMIEVVLGEHAALAPGLDLRVLTSARPDRRAAGAGLRRSRRRTHFMSSGALERGASTWDGDFAPRDSPFLQRPHRLLHETLGTGRRGLAREMRETYGAWREESMRLRFLHAQTAASPLTAQQPLNNGRPHLA